MASLAVPMDGSVYGGRGPAVLGATWTLFTLATIMMTARYYVKLGVKRPGKWPLIWITLSYIAAIACQIACTIAVRGYGIGNHTPLLTKAGTIGPGVFWNWMTSSLALLSIGIGKLAAVVLILSIQGQTKPVGRIALYTLAAINMSIDAADMIGLWFQCDPVEKLWNTPLPGVCNNKQAVVTLSMAAGGTNAVTDFFLALYPSYIIWNLKAPLRIKIGLCVLLGLSMFTGVCAAIKISKLPTIGNTTDPTYEIAQLLVWGLVEMWVVIIVALVPPTYPLVKSIVEGTRSTNAYSHGKPDYFDHDGFSNGLRGDKKSVMKGRGYVDQSLQSYPEESSTTNLPDNCIMMKQEVYSQKDTTHLERGHASNSSESEVEFRG